MWTTRTSHAAIVLSLPPELGISQTKQVLQLMTKKREFILKAATSGSCKLSCICKTCELLKDHNNAYVWGWGGGGMGGSVFVNYRIDFCRFGWLNTLLSRLTYS